jgi:glycosyltransferase involved in cell wall biosynthesis
VNRKKVPKLDIVGDGPLKNELAELIKILGLSSHINLLGIRTDIKELLYSHDLFVFSSRWEGLPIVLIEALASGIPIISTDVGSTLGNN